MVSTTLTLSSSRFALFSRTAASTSLSWLTETTPSPSAASSLASVWDSQFSVASASTTAFFSSAVISSSPFIVARSVLGVTGVVYT